MSKFKLDPVVKAKWVAALRSGKYKQGTGRRKTMAGGSPTYCCLGVAHKLGLAKPEGQCFVEESFLPLDIQYRLASYNDGSDLMDMRRAPIKKKDFKAIATWIEENL